jgi:NAD(P)-dependent dehydrogenase (short-subunit alcohol dehydrogenase family)
MSNAQKVAIVTGASQGIGAGIVEAFRSRNYKVVANSRSIKEIDDPDVVTVQGDVADPKTADLVFAEALKHFGHVDTLVNNAGIFMAKPFTTYSKDNYAVYLETNVTGFFHMTQRAMETMNKQGRGHVVTITTSLVDQPMSSVPAVLASLTKGALSAATKSLAIEYAKSGVRVNAVSAGIIKTPAADAALPGMTPAEIHRFFATLHPMGRMGEISEIVDAVMYLDSAGFVTGEILHVDGGQAAGHHAL